MATKQLLSGHNRSDLGNGATGYSPCFYGSRYVWAAADFAGAYTGCVPTAGTIANFKAFLTVAPGDGKSWTFTVYKNGSATDIQVAISGDATSGQDTTHSLVVAAGDYLSVQSVPTGTPAVAKLSQSAEFTPSTDAEFIFGGSSSGVSVGTGAYLLLGHNASVAAEAQAQIVVPCAGTIKKLQMILSIQPGEGDSCTLTARKNGADQALAVTVAGANYANIDSANSFSVVAGDLISFLYTKDETANTRVSFSFVFVPSSAAHVPYLSCYPIANFTNVGSYSIDGLFANGFATQQLFGLQGIALYVFLVTAPGGAASRTISLGIGGEASALSVTITGASTTGNDTGESVVIGAGGVLTFINTESGGDAANSLGSVGLLCTASTAEPPYDDGTSSGGVGFGGQVVEVGTWLIGDVTGSGGALAGGSATVQTNIRLTITGTGGSVAGGIPVVNRIVSIGPSGGSVVGGSADNNRIVAAVVDGGGIVGGSSDKTNLFILAANTAGGALAGGSALKSHLYVATGNVSGGSVAGGSADVTWVGLQTLSVTGNGGAVAGGSSALVKIVSITASGGAIAGGSCDVTWAGLQTVTATMLGGGICGGSYTGTVLKVFTPSGGMVAGGTYASFLRVAIPKTDFHPPTGGSVVGGAVVPTKTAIPTPSGGAVGGGTASIIQTYLATTVTYTATGGAVIGGTALFGVRIVTESVGGGAVVGGAAARNITHTKPVSGGAVSGGVGTFHYGFVFVGGGGIVAGGTSTVPLFTRSFVGAGGAVAGGTYTSTRTQITAVSGGAVVGGSFILHTEGGLWLEGGVIEFESLVPRMMFLGSRPVFDFSGYTSKTSFDSHKPEIEFENKTIRMKVR